MAQRFTDAEKSLSLNLTARYSPSWKIWEGIRELVQNWHDGIFSSLEKLQDGVGSGTFLRSRVSFLSCRDEESLAYKAVLTAENSSSNDEGKAKGNSNSNDQKSVLRDRSHKLDEIFHDEKGFYQETPANQGIELGKIVYFPSRQRLSLINYNTELMRKVLLLGYSKKASNKEVIGQFGEGLKVGALALVREGRVVTLETSGDRWRFGLLHDDTFEEEVLTVFVTERNEKNDDDDDDDDDVITLGLTDTGVTVFPLSFDDFEAYMKRFLFLHPPSDYVKSETGTLLIGDQYKGQLYVKGVWVSDMSKDGLVSGVDFVHLKIDRDRRAVVHLSHQISSMWVHAIEQRPELISYYYRLLEENNSSDIRHANFYLTDKSAFLVAQHFFAIHGETTYPVLNTVSAELLDEIKREIDQKLVLCNESLIHALYKSGAVEPLEAILSKSSTRKSVLVPYADLTHKEVNVLKHIEKLVQLCCPEFSMVTMDVSESTETGVLMKEFGHYEISRGVFSNLPIEHFDKETCGKSGARCLCREAFIAAKILTLQPNNESVQSGKSSFDNDRILKLVASLSVQVCRLNPPFCKELHEKQTTMESAMHHSVLREREMELQKEKEVLMKTLLQKDKSHAQELKKLQSKISSMEKDLVSQQVNLANAEQEISESWKKGIHKLEKKMAVLSNTITDLKRDRIFYKEKLAAALEDAANKQKAHACQVSVLNDRNDIL